MDIKFTHWKSGKGAFVDVETSQGIRIRGIKLFYGEKPNVQMPGSEYIDKNGRKRWKNACDFGSKQSVFESYLIKRFEHDLERMKIQLAGMKEKLVELKKAENAKKEHSELAEKA